MSASPLARLGLPSPDEGEAGESTTNRKAVLGMAGLAVAAVAVAGVLVLGGGADDLGDLGTSPAAAAAGGSLEPAAPPPASATPAPAPSFPAATEVRDGRDPFVALLEPPAPPQTTSGTAPAPTGQEPEEPHEEDRAPGPGTVAGPGTTGTSGGAPPGSSGGTPPSMPRDGGTARSSIALLRVEGPADARSAVLTIDGAEQRATVGESFGPSGALLLLSLQEGPDVGQWTAVVQVGQGEPFDLVTGAVVPLPTAS